MCIEMLFLAQYLKIEKDLVTSSATTPSTNHLGPVQKYRIHAVAPGGNLTSM